MLKEKIGRILPAIVALLLLGASMATSAQARVSFRPATVNAGSGVHTQLRSGNAAEWIAATAAAIAAVGGAAEESTVVIIIVLATSPSHQLPAAQRAAYSASFDR